MGHFITSTQTLDLSVFTEHLFFAANCRINLLFERMFNHSIEEQQKIADTDNKPHRITMN